MGSALKEGLMSPFRGITSWMLKICAMIHPGLHLGPLQIPSVITDGSHGEFPRVYSPARCIWALLVA